MMIAYKLLKKRKDGTLGPLYINRKQRIPTGVWLDAECVPTKGFAVRQGWHVTAIPHAPHIKPKDYHVWCEVQIDDFYEFIRPMSQGGHWYIAQKMRILP